MTIRREPQRRKLTTLNSGMSVDLLAMRAVLKAPELSSTILLTVKLIFFHSSELFTVSVSINLTCFVLSWIFFLGIILVQDLTNKKSSLNLYRWSLEALNKDSSPTGVIVSNG